MAMSEIELKENNAAIEQDALDAQAAETASGIKPSQKVIWTGKGRHIVTTDLAPYTVIKSKGIPATDTQPLVEAGAAWVMYQYIINGQSGFYPQPKLPKGTYVRVLTQNVKDTEKGGYQFIPA